MREGGVDRLGVAVALDNPDSGSFVGLGFDTVLPAFAPYTERDVSHAYMVKQLSANAIGSEAELGGPRPDMLGA